MNFSNDTVQNIIIKHVHLKRATKEHVEEFKKFLNNDIEDIDQTLIIDLSECECIDSTFISALVIALKSVTKNNGLLKIVASHPDVQSILELTGMIKVFETYNSISEAILSFEKTNSPS